MIFLNIRRIIKKYVFVDPSLKMEKYHANYFLSRNNRAYDCGQEFSRIGVFLNFQPSEKGLSVKCIEYKLNSLEICDDHIKHDPTSEDLIRVTL